MRTSTSGRRSAVAGLWAATMAGGGVTGCASSGAASGNGAQTASAPATERQVATGRRAGTREIDDSVQVGYGTQNRRRMTGSVSTVSGDDTRSQHLLRVEEMLQRVPGVVVSPRGDGSYSVVIRGSSALSAYSRTDPLVVVDGLPVDDGIGVLNTLSPEDIERIDVLKDSEASIYGSRAGNGVLLVRTRHMRTAKQ